jgi:mRNA interferase MazF
MAPKSGVPDRGDIIWLHFNPQAGHEQAGHRPAVVLSPKSYNRMFGLLICSPMTSRIKNLPFEVRIQSQGSKSVALADQIKSIDWVARNAHVKGRATHAEIDEILNKFAALVGL